MQASGEIFAQGFCFPSHLNHAIGVYVIATKLRMESARRAVWNQADGYTLMRDAIHVFDVIPCRRLATDAMPSLSAWIKIKSS